MIKSDSSLSPTRIATGSWDKSALVYDSSFNVKFRILSHSESVNDVLFLPNNGFLTASSDKTIILWDLSDPAIGPMQIRAFNGHEDCVRGLLQLEGDANTFLSISNDQTVRMWELSTGSTLRIFLGHTHFIFSIARLGNSGQFITGGEDKTLMIWNKNKAEPNQTIKVPVTTIWSIIALDEFTFVAGASDGKLYVFTKRPDFVTNELLVFEEMFARENVIPFENVKHLKLFEEDSLLNLPAQKDGEQRLIRSVDDNKVLVYNYNKPANKWEVTGHVSEYVHQEEYDSLGRVFFNGQYYDEVLNVKLFKKTFKLAINRDEDPWLVASRFLQSHNMEPELVEVIVQSIVTYASYKPKKVDTFGYFPIYDFKIFDQNLDMTKFKPKLEEFNKQASAEGILTQTEIDAIASNYLNPSAEGELFVKCFKKFFIWQSKRYLIIKPIPIVKNFCFS